jgi:hypothetical protein
MIMRKIELKFSKLYKKTGLIVLMKGSLRITDERKLTLNPSVKFYFFILFPVMI